MAQEGFPSTQNGGDAATQPPPSLYLGKQYPTRERFARQAAQAMAGVRAASSARRAYLTGLLTLDIHGQMITGTDTRPLTSSKTPPKNPRGKVTTFSQASRRRLLRFFAAINPDLLADPLFLSLTFHWDKDKGAAYTALANFLKSVRRRHVDAQWLWRMELQKRGVIHFHAFIWRGVSAFTTDPDPTWAKWLHETWHRVAEPVSDAHAEHGALVEPVRSASKAMRYLTKYMAKELELDAKIAGRRWGHSSGIPREPIASAALDELQQVAFRRIMRRLVIRSHPRGEEGCAPKLSAAQRVERRKAAGITELRNVPTPNEPVPFRRMHRHRMRGYVQEARVTHLFCHADTAFRVLTQVCKVTFDPQTRETTPPWYQTTPAPDAQPTYRTTGLSRDQINQAVREALERQRADHKPRRTTGRKRRMRKSRQQSETQQLELLHGTTDTPHTKKPTQTTHRQQKGSTPPPRYPPKAKNWPKSSSPAGGAAEVTTRPTATRSNGDTDG